MDGVSDHVHLARNVHDDDKCCYGLYLFHHYLFLTN
jgi:hypothetical protein